MAGIYSDCSAREINKHVLSSARSLSGRGTFVVGGSLAVVGSVPLVITLSLGVNSSATIIGVGFVGFGFLIIVPGLCWCRVTPRHWCLVTRWRPLLVSGG